MRNNNYKYLKDVSFLTKLAKLPLLSSLVKISFLDWEENIIKQIESQVISGNINIDGNSAIRRTASLGLILKEDEDIQNLFLINKKINVQVGYYNETDEYIEYPILWFPQGVFVITNFSLSHGLDGLSVSLELKDKMCLLNGQCGGVLPASTVFDNYETIDENGQYVITRPTIYQIIKQLVNHFGGQNLTKIIISDLDLKVKQAMQWNYSSPLYFLRKNGQSYVTADQNDYLSKIDEGWIDVDGSPFSQGDTVGFVYTDFTYPGDLIGDAGQSVVDILQKIKETLGNYEYFYDIDGNFIFQQIKNFLNNSQSKYILESLQNNQTIPDYLSSTRQVYLLDQANGNIMFDFSKDNSVLISSYSRSPQLPMIKNDFIVWGIRTVTDNKEIPIRYHLAIDKKPKIGNTYYFFDYEQEGTEIKKWTIPLDFDNYDDFPLKGEVDKYYRNKNNNIIYKWGKNGNGEYQYIATGYTIKRITTKDWRTQLYFQGVAADTYGTNKNFYYTELVNEWPKIYNIEPDVFNNQTGKWQNNSDFKEETWKYPNQIDYFLDFVDTTQNIGKYSINNIGRRSKIINDGKNSNCIFEAYIPDIVLLNLGDENIAELRSQCEQKNQKYYQIENYIYNNLTIGGNQYSCYQSIRQILHEYLNYNDSISLQILPLYFLEPNNCIQIQDKQSHIEGKYLINSISFNLGDSSQMSINASKILQKI